MNGSYQADQATGLVCALCTSTGGEAHVVYTGAVVILPNLCWPQYDFPQHAIFRQCYCVICRGTFWVREDL